MVAEVEAETSARVSAIAAEAQREIERYEAVHAARADAIATVIADALVARVRAEAPP